MPMLLQNSQISINVVLAFTIFAARFSAINKLNEALLWARQIKQLLEILLND
jgi:hypothetical protein